MEQPPSGLTFWDALTAEEQRALAALAKVRTFRAGTLLCREGDNATPVFVIESGWVKVSAKIRGRERIVAVRGPGDVVGERIMRDKKARTATVTVLDEVRAQVVLNHRFSAFLVVNAGAARVLEQLDEERRAQDAALGLPYGPAGAERRLARLLLELARHRRGRGGGGGRRAVITISISEQELANWLNARPDEVASFLRTWRERGIVEASRRQLSVIDLDGLNRISENTT